MSVRPIRRSKTLAMLGATAVLIAACGGDDDTEPAEPETEAGDNGDAEPITLVVDVFGEQGFGYEALYEEYMEQNPHVTIEERGAGLGVGDYNDRLVQQITAGSGAGDVVALEEGTIVQFYAQLDKFVDLAEYGAGDLQDNFLPWKWEQGTPGGFILGLGTDVGSMAMCYRRDLFEEAGLPTDRDEVSAMWPTWDEYIDVGGEFVDADVDAEFLDAATNVYNTMLMQIAGNNSGYTYYDTENNLDLDNPDIKAAWDMTIEMIENDLSAGLNSFSDEWNAGFQGASFATIACPAWMTGVIAGAAGDEAEGLWDVADAPGDGGNWGGSFLAVPAETEHPAEAAELAKFLTTPEAHIEAFEALGNLPSSPQALEDDAVLESTNEYFNDAPTGEIFGSGAFDLKPVHLGPQNNAIRTAFEDALRSVEQGERSPDEAWQAARDAASGIG
ncbi:extracellular solute-binding protein [Actinobacteria bacterium YIM 96077]|uniref:Carbohydrate ABC transporter substrate-binding protein n=1 Tax=Phytoactinopolyspora halophila TaxID=1981511 RepID=A0A329QAD9_9ACTN|nr:extracellular solute-binding protein [Phytoactinopolyspora halophila]AYY12910.1 extracellular solute-binding protein [Actinobacteria bacterium YIM 96077]RAW09293.1 carbohydrate ABC transporter substrate-binding protein [Phytoactinopolyspora halophila]